MFYYEFLQMIKTTADFNLALSPVVSVIYNRLRWGINASEEARTYPALMQALFKHEHEKSSNETGPIFKSQI